MNARVFIPNSPGGVHYLHKASQYELLTRENEAVLGRRLRGEASLDILVSNQTFLFARDYAAHAVVFCPDSRFAKAWDKYSQTYPVSGNGTLDEEVAALREMYSHDLSHYDGFVATTARYLIGFEEYARRVSPPIWRTAWRKEEKAFSAIQKKESRDCSFFFR